MTENKIADYATVGDSITLKAIGDKPFTIKAVEKSNYEQGNEVTEGVKITTVENFEIEGVSHSKFHTTRIAIVRKLLNPKLIEDLKTQPLGPVKCVTEQSKSGKDFFNLVDC